MEEYVKVSARTSYFVTKPLEPLQIQGFQVIFQPVTAHYRQLPFACPLLTVFATCRVAQSLAHQSTRIKPLLMTRSYQPKSAVECPIGTTPEETARHYGRLITKPELHAYRIVKAAEEPGLASQIDTPGLMAALKEQIQAVNAGDLRHAEAMLISQATSLQTLFSRLTERAMAQNFLQTMEPLLKLALRCQNQSRQTLETLATVRNPPLVVARQANIGTNVQVNNGTGAPCAGKNENEQTQLLSEGHGTTMDSSGATAPIGIDSAVETVGALDRTAHGDR